MFAYMKSDFSRFPKSASTTNTVFPKSTGSVVKKCTPTDSLFDGSQKLKAHTLVYYQYLCWTHVSNIMTAKQFRS